MRTSGDGRDHQGFCVSKDLLVPDITPRLDPDPGSGPGLLGC